MVLVGLLLVAKLVLLSHCKGEKERERNGNHKGGVCFFGTKVSEWKRWVKFMPK